MPSTLTAVDVSGSCTERGTEPSAPWWKTISTPRTAVWTRSYERRSPSTTSTSSSEVGEVLAAPGREVVEHPHGVAAGEQRADEVRADEAGAAGDERGSCHGADDIRCTEAGRSSLRGVPAVVGDRRTAGAGQCYCSQPIASQSSAVAGRPGRARARPIRRADESSDRDGEPERGRLAARERGPAGPDERARTEPDDEHETRRCPCPPRPGRTRSGRPTDAPAGKASAATSGNRARAASRYGAKFCGSSDACQPTPVTGWSRKMRRPM